MNLVTTEIAEDGKREAGLDLIYIEDEDEDDDDENEDDDEVQEDDEKVVDEKEVDVHTAGTNDGATSSKPGEAEAETQSAEAEVEKNAKADEAKTSTKVATNVVFSKNEPIPATPSVWGSASGPSPWGGGGARGFRTCC